MIPTRARLAVPVGDGGIVFGWGFVTVIAQALTVVAIHLCTVAL